MKNVDGYYVIFRLWGYILTYNCAVCTVFLFTPKKQLSLFKVWLPFARNDWFDTSFSIGGVDFLCDHILYKFRNKTMDIRIIIGLDISLSFDYVKPHKDWNEHSVTIVIPFLCVNIIKSYEFPKIGSSWVGILDGVEETVEVVSLPNDGRLVRFKLLSPNNPPNDMVVTKDEFLDIFKPLIP